MRKRCFGLLLVSILFSAVVAFAQANGKLQIHFMDVGQGDGAVLISPGGQVVLFDDGTSKGCDKPVSYLQQLGITKIDYHFTSHYHSDHIGCAPQVFQEIALPGAVLDRGGSYPSTVFQNYVTAAGSHRQTATQGMEVILDQGSANPVTIDVVALAGNGIATTNENDLSLVAVVHFGQFAAEFGGDLSGFQTQNYQDIETSVAPVVGSIDVYKVHHHCSAYSTNDTWLATTKPKVAIISVGDGNVYRHPTSDCLERLHLAGVKTYWTETGNGADPDPAYDTVGKNIVVEVDPAAQDFTLTPTGASSVTYPIGAAGGGTAGGGTTGGVTTPAQTQYAWSKNSNVYHYANCKYVQNISPENLVRGATPPAGKTLHRGCPK
jgi:beta-lactamase superfamily II metal-dependent hydrolase